jgi:hypothetical protein
MCRKSTPEEGNETFLWPSRGDGTVDLPRLYGEPANDTVSAALVFWHTLLEDDNGKVGIPHRTFPALPYNLFASTLRV